MPKKETVNVRPWELLLRNVSLLQSVLEEADPPLSRIDLDFKRLFILCLVEQYSFPADLARILATPKPSMTFLVKKLEASGFLRRQGEEGDLRRYRLTLTAAGRKARDKGVEVVDGIFGHRLEAISVTDRSTFSRLIDALQRG